MQFVLEKLRIFLRLFKHTKFVLYLKASLLTSEIRDYILLLRFSFKQKFFKMNLDTVRSGLASSMTQNSLGESLASTTSHYFFFFPKRNNNKARGLFLRYEQ